MASINILKRAAEEIAREAADLFLQGAGIPIVTDENLDPLEEMGIIDELGNDTPAFRWVNAVLMFLRTVNGILNNSIDRSNLIEAADILTEFNEDT